jgi:hypothetical protein
MTKLNPKWIASGTIAENIEYTGSSSSATNIATIADISSATTDDIREAVITRGYVGNATVATINGLSPSAGNAYVVTGPAGTITGGPSVSEGDLVEFNGTSWVLLAANSGGYVPADIRVIASTTVALISPLTDGTDDGKIFQFSGSSNTPVDQSEATDGTLTAVVPGPDGSSVDAYVLFSFTGTVPTGSWNAITVADGAITESKLAVDAVATNNVVDGAIDENKLNVSVAGDGIQGGGGSPLDVDVSDFAGDGLEDDGSENLQVDNTVVRTTGVNAFTANQPFGSNKITNLGDGTDPKDAVNKSQLDAALAGLDFQPDVLDVQIDATLDPGASPTDGDRYIITDASNLNSNFGTINKLMDGTSATLEDNDIVEYDSAAGEFRIAYDVSAEGPGALCWDRDSTTWQRWDGTTWDDFGGLAGVTAGAGLSKAGNTLSANVDGSTVVVNVSDELEVNDGGIDTAQLANDAVDATKIADDAVGSAAIATGAVGTAELADDAVDASKLADGAISYPALADEYKAAGVALLSAKLLGDGPAATLSSGLSGYATGSTFLVTGTGGTIGGTSFSVGDVGMVTSTTTTVKITDLTEQPKFIAITTDTLGGATATEVVYEVKSDGGTGATYTVVINPASDDTTNISAVVVGVDNALSEANEKLLEIGRTLTFDPSTDNWRTIRQIYPGSNIEIDNDGTINATSEPAIADVYVMTIEPLPAYTYSSAAGTITADANGALPDIDDRSLSVGDTLLVIDADTGDVAFGIYEVTDLGDASNPFVLTRTTLEEGDTFNPGYSILVRTGRAGNDRSFYLINAGTVGTDALYFSEKTPASALPVQDVIWFVGSVADYNGQTFADIPEFVGAIIKDSGTITIGATNFSVSANTIVYRVGDEVTGPGINADGRYITDFTFGLTGDISSYMPGTPFVFYNDTGVAKDIWPANAEFRHLTVSGGYFQGQSLARTGDGTISINKRLSRANVVIEVSNIERDAVTLPVTAPSGFSNSDLFVATGQASDNNFIAYYGDSFAAYYYGGQSMFDIRPGDVIAVKSTGEFLLVTEAYGGAYDGSIGTLKFTDLKPAANTVEPKAQTELSAYTAQYSFTAGTNTGTYNATAGEDGVGQITSIADSELSAEAPTPQVDDVVFVFNRTSGQNGIYKVTARGSGVSDLDRIDVKLLNGAVLTDTSKQEVIRAELDTNRTAVWGTDDLKGLITQMVTNKHTLTLGEVTNGGFNLTASGAPTPDTGSDPCFTLIPLGGVYQERGVDFEVSQISGGTNDGDYFISFDSSASEPGGGTVTDPSTGIPSLTAGDKIVNCFRSREVAIS